jgi:hypothetical protein
MQDAEGDEWHYRRSERSGGSLGSKTYDALLPYAETGNFAQRNMSDAACLLQKLSGFQIKGDVGKDRILL